ncbi:PREDICTED: uncharacterized protein K02A2.6-like [Cyphomyrmex costatus]|uniref:uncharacterized protein K02A2.6-like n=1 Tax=Cyphomyrmex costatus TaxID=456900 RepID=UPI0008523EC5|nr:PREDICTED: uncharacterized protein K02A2.6-like [Cyphomyrmex costatus]
MEVALQPPPALLFEGNIAEKWKRWKQKLELYLVATGLNTQPEIRQVAVLLHTIGEEALEKFNTFGLSEEEKKKLPIVLEAFERLLREDDLNLERCIKICKAAELVQQQIKTLATETKVLAVNAKQNTAQTGVNKQQANKNRRPGRKNNHARKALPSPSTQDANTGQQMTTKTCYRCGTKHPLHQCPAYRKTCAKCKKLNHFAKVCKSVNNNVKSIEQVEQDASQAEFVEQFFIGCIDAKRNHDWSEKLLINNSKTLVVKLDSGAQCNVLPLKIFDELELSRSIVQKSNAKLTTYGGNPITVVGKCCIKCTTSKNVITLIEFEVVDAIAPAALGLPTLSKLNLLKRVETVNVTNCNIKQFVQGSGCISNYEYDIKLKHNTGHIEPCRRVPLRLRDKLQKELQKMEDEGIVEKVQEPTDWVNALVVVTKKDGSLRVCLDPHHLNQAIQREYHYIPTFEDLCSKMAGSRVFSTLDADRAFWQIKLTEKSSKLTTFNTPYGRYKFLRLPYGISSAPEVFHRCFQDIFSNIEGVEVYLDDIIVHGKDETEHNKRLMEVLNRAQLRGVKLNLNKCKIGLSRIKYMGHIFSSEGISPDPNKVTAILSMKQPTHVKELETFLGMLTYLGRFIPNLSQKSTKLRNLTKRNTVWLWDQNAEQAFNDLKNSLSTAPVLQFFDSRKPVVVSVDASQSGLGAVLLQNNLPVEYASRSLNDTQQNYAQIEKEALAIAFACKRFHYYIYGRQVVVESDHKPLEAIFAKPLNKCPARLQRIRLMLQPYDIRVQYKPGKELYLADALSRSYLTDESSLLDEEIEAQVCMIRDNLPISDPQYKRFIHETLHDANLQLLRQYIENGWPINKHSIPDSIRVYATFKDELSIIDNLIYKGIRLVVPSSLRQEMLKRIHYNHLGIEKCKSRAREILFWPGMSKQITDIIQNCETCLRYQRAQKKETFVNKDIPQGPWQVIGVDLFYYAGCEYLLAVDYFSKYAEMAKLSDSSSSTVITHLKSMFARFGIPNIIYSDNGPQFKNSYFREFSSKWNFEHKTSSPRYPQSNGLVERFVGTVKQMLKKCGNDGKDIYLALLEYRNTPISDKIPSPTELMFGRKTRSILPTMLKDSCEQTRQLLEERRSVQRKYYNRSAKDLSSPKLGDQVLVRKDMCSPLQPAQVIDTCDRPRSFKIAMQDGSTVERNRRHIYKAPRTLKPLLCTSELEDYMPPTFDCNTSNKVDDSNAGSHIEQNSNNSPETKRTVEKADNSPTPLRTRSSRLVKPPSYLKDYVTH